VPTLRVIFAIVLVVSVAGWLAARTGESAVATPAPAFDPADANASGTAVLAGGCFWGVQAVFEHVRGVSQVVAGYSGGAKPNPTYEEVSAENTGHAETVQITYNPARVSFGTLLQVYFSVAHDPTQLNRQGPDEGPSYRSNIFYTSDAQQRVAEAYIDQLNKAGRFSRPLVTRVDRFTAFYPAEKYHQDYLVTHPTSPYIVINDLPKLAEFKRLLPSLYADQPALVGSK
jgi:peptide-methionine (S)-S-oxide reductase